MSAAGTIKMQSASGPRWSYSVGTWLSDLIAATENVSNAWSSGFDAPLCEIVIDERAPDCGAAGPEEQSVTIGAVRP